MMRQNRTMYLSATLLVLVFLATGRAQSNLLTNPGFEDSVHVAWRLNAWGGTAATLSNETGDKVIFGNISARVEVTTPAADKIEKVSLMTPPIVTAPRQGDLFISAYARTASRLALSFKLSVKCVGADGSKKWYGGEEATLTPAAQKFTFIVSPDVAYRDTIYVRLSCGKSVGGYVFDDVVLRANEESTVPVPSGKRLREIVADKYPDGNVFIGGATQPVYWNTPSEIILNREFSYITPANDFKQTYIHPSPGVWRWESPDAWVQKAAANGQVIRMHSPISPQCSKWAKDDARTPEELLQNLEEYVPALCQRYNRYDHILWMDVVNETIDAKTGEWFGPKPGTDRWENPWTIIGFDTAWSDTFQPPVYIKRAFELANQYAPDIKQIINQHGTMNAAAWDKVKMLVRYLRDNGLRVDGIGFQAHVDVGWENEVNDCGVNNIVALGELIDWAHAHDLEFHITENNVALKNENQGKWEEQAETFKAIVKTVLSRRDAGVVTWNVWMIRDSDGQKGYANPVLFRQDGSAKPAYYAVQEVLENPESSVKSAAFAPKKIELYENYPNPFNQTTTISFVLPRKSRVVLDVFNIRGNKVAMLVDGKLEAGVHSINFDAAGLGSGVYFYKMIVDDFVQTGKMSLLK